MGSSPSKVKVYSMVVLEELDQPVGGAAVTKPASGKFTLSSPTRSDSSLFSSPVSNNRKSISLTPPVTPEVDEFVCSKAYPWLIKEADFSKINWDALEFGKLIGQGRLSSLRLAKLSGKHFVFKSIRKDHIAELDEERHIRSEKACLQALHSPFIVKLFGTFTDKKYVCLALEYVTGGDLLHTRLSHGPLPAEEAKFYMSELACALEHMHSLHMVHRDVTPENIAIDEEGHIKLIDFGYATYCLGEQRLQTICGQPAYMAPERLDDNRVVSGYTAAVDWWAYGVLLFQLLTNKTPFSSDASDTPEQILFRILKEQIPFPKAFDRLSREFITALLKPKLSERLHTLDPIKCHAYFTVPWHVIGERKVIPPFVPKLSAKCADTWYFSHCVGETKPEGKVMDKRLTAFLQDF